MSPVPPVPMAGVPVGLIQTRPSGNAIRVRSPFSTTTTCRPIASPRAAETRSAEISAVVLPQRRAISPGCGVSTRSLPPPSHAAPAIVGHGDRVIVVDDHLDVRGVATEGFVHRVIDYFIDQVVQTHFARRDRK